MSWDVNFTGPLAKAVHNAHLPVIPVLWTWWSGRGHEKQEGRIVYQCEKDEESEW